MTEELPIKVVEDNNGNKYYLDSILGQGGQGMVCRTQDKNLAIKFLISDDKIVENEKKYNLFQDKINDVVIMNFDKDIKLCKPEIMLKKPMCGYVMKLLSDLKPINRLIYDANSDGNFNDYYIKSGSLKKRLEVLLELSRTLSRLHSKGVVYCDISQNNVFYSDTNNFSNVWLIDCDNLKFTADAKKGIFTPGYGAPEIEANVTSNTIYSDCFSFAILAFRVLTSRNPFEQDYSQDSSSDGWDASTTDEIKSTSNIDWILENDKEKDREYFKHFIDLNLLDLFDLTFNKTGRLNPQSRPSMRTWYDTLKTCITELRKCECESFILASDEKCPFCNVKRNIKYYINIFNIFNKASFGNIVDEVNENIKKDEIDGVDFTNEQIQLIKKSNYEKKYNYPTVIYNGLRIYNFNLFEVTIYDNPYAIVEFKIYNNNLFATNVSKKVLRIRKMGEAQDLLPGNSTQLEFDSSKKCNIYLVDSITKLTICVNVTKV